MTWSGWRRWSGNIRRIREHLFHFRRWMSGRYLNLFYRVLWTMVARFYFSFSKNFLYVISISGAPSGAVIIKSSKRQKGRLPMCNGYPQRHPQEQRGWLQLPARVCRISQIIFWIRKLYFWLSERRPYWQQPADRKQRLCPQAILQWQWAEKKSQGRWWLICGEVQGKIHLHSRYKAKNLDKGHLLS